jgi:hypothetical protein
MRRSSWAITAACGLIVGLGIAASGGCALFGETWVCLVQTTNIFEGWYLADDGMIATELNLQDAGRPSCPYTDCFEVAVTATARASRVELFDVPCADDPSKACVRSSFVALGPSAAMVVTGDGGSDCSRRAEISLPALAVSKASGSVPAKLEGDVYVGVMLDVQASPPSGTLVPSLEQTDHVWLKYVGPTDGSGATGDTEGGDGETGDSTGGENIPANWTLLTETDFEIVIKNRIARVEGRPIDDPCQTTTLCDLAPATPSTASE